MEGWKGTEWLIRAQTGLMRGSAGLIGFQLATRMGDVDAAQPRLPRDIALGAVGRSTLALCA